MIEQIRIQNTASYNEQGVDLINLRKVNIFYGSNGSGKTTISRVIDNVRDDQYKKCSLKWSENIELDTFVYNQDFIDKNFNQDGQELKGIFTLGEADEKKLNTIKKYKEDIDTLKADIKKLRKQIDGSDNDAGKAKDLENLETGFTETCWKLKLKHDEHFIQAFADAKVRGDSKKFKAKVVFEAENNDFELIELEKLKKKAETVFSSDQTKQALITTFTYDEFKALETHDILVKNIIGKEDVDIAEMITRLGNSDWVEQGRSYFQQNDDHCPFCQQETEKNFSESLEAYFDETYKTQINTLEDVVKKYQECSVQLISELEEIYSQEHKYLDQSAFETQKDLVKTKINANIELLQKKQKEASSFVILDMLKDSLAQLNRLISDANEEAQKHNDMVDDHINVKNDLISQIWFFIVNEIKDQYASYKKKKSDLDKAIANINQQIEAKEAEKTQTETEQTKLQSQITGVEATVADINSILSSFGFTSFKLAESKESKGYYKIIRDDGKDARKSLSEGEKTFVTFLYFYHLLNGGNTEDEIDSDRVVVIDDPVSSLDSDVLFIVSTLIRSLIKDTMASKKHIKQVSILTHNIYFHNKTAFNLTKGKKEKRICDKNDVSYMVVRKINNISSVVEYDENPIKTSYELLWDDLRKHNYSNHTAQNTMRRILENYFVMFGGYDQFDNLIEQFEGEEKNVFVSLIAWLHDGSHNIYDDLNLSCTDDQVATQLKVFAKIFKVTGHGAHYDMMMQKDDSNVIELKTVENTLNTNDDNIALQSKSLT